MPETQDYNVQEELVEFLIEKIEADTYPSATQMDLVEELLEPQMVERYARTLMAKLSASMYPSIDLLHRIRRLA